MRFINSPSNLESKYYLDKILKFLQFIKNLVNRDTLYCIYFHSLCESESYKLKSEKNKISKKKKSLSTIEQNSIQLITTPISKNIKRKLGDSSDSNKDKKNLITFNNKENQELQDNLLHSVKGIREIKYSESPYKNINLPFSNNSNCKTVKKNSTGKTNSLKTNKYITPKFPVNEADNNSAKKNQRLNNFFHDNFSNTNNKNENNKCISVSVSSGNFYNLPYYNNLPFQSPKIKNSITKEDSIKLNTLNNNNNKIKNVFFYSQEKNYFKNIMESFREKKSNNKTTNEKSQVLKNSFSGKLIYEVNKTKKMVFDLDLNKNNLNNKRKNKNKSIDYNLNNLFVKNFVSSPTLKTTSIRKKNKSNSITNFQFSPNRDTNNSLNYEIFQTNYKNYKKYSIDTEDYYFNKKINYPNDANEDLGIYSVNNNSNNINNTLEIKNINNPILNYENKKSDNNYKINEFGEKNLQFENCNPNKNYKKSLINENLNKDDNFEYEIYDFNSLTNQINLRSGNNLKTSINYNLNEESDMCENILSNMFYILSQKLLNLKSYGFNKIILNSEIQIKQNKRYGIKIFKNVLKKKIIFLKLKFLTACKINYLFFNFSF